MSDIVIKIITVTYISIHIDINVNRYMHILYHYKILRSKIVDKVLINFYSIFN